MEWIRRLWKWLLGWRKEESAEQHPHIRIGQGEYTKDIWLDNNHWKQDHKNKWHYKDHNW